MIKHFTDHTANMRTYLAWVRTAIAIMAFGFIIEKFNIFIIYIEHALGKEGHFQHFKSAEIVSLTLFIVSIVIIIGSTGQFFFYQKTIDSEKIIKYKATRTVFLISTLIVLLGAFLTIYIGFQVFK